MCIVGILNSVTGERADRLVTRNETRNRERRQITKGFHTLSHAKEFRVDHLNC